MEHQLAVTASAWLHIAAQQAGTSAAGGYLGELVRTLLALLAVIALAWLSLRLLARRGFGRAAVPGAPAQVLQRLPLDARRSLFVVRVGERVLLLGVGDGAAPSLLAELDPSALSPAPGPAVESASGGRGDATDAPR